MLTTGALLPLSDVTVIKLDRRGELFLTGSDLSGAPLSASTSWFAYTRRLKGGAVMEVRGVRLGNKIWSVMRRHQ